MKDILASPCCVHAARCHVAPASQRQEDPDSALNGPEGRCARWHCAAQTAARQAAAATAEKAYFLSLLLDAGLIQVCINHNPSPPAFLFLGLSFYPSISLSLSLSLSLYLYLPSSLPPSLPPSLSRVRLILKVLKGLGSLFIFYYLQIKVLLDC